MPSIATSRARHAPRSSSLSRPPWRGQSPLHPRPARSPAEPRAAVAASTVMHRTVKVDGLDIFYREAGPKSAPTVLLLHGFPTSSHMFRNLIPPSPTGTTSSPPTSPGTASRACRAATASLHVREPHERHRQVHAGARARPLHALRHGLRRAGRLPLALAHPERVQALIVQNGNAYDEGLREFLDPIKAYWADGSAEHRNACAKS
jgi:hypothetical protein